MNIPGASDDERKVLGVIRSLLDQLQLDADHRLSLESDLTSDLGLDSLALVELCDLLEGAFDVALPDEVFLTASTPRDWLDSIHHAQVTNPAAFASSVDDRDDDQGGRVGAHIPRSIRRLSDEVQRRRAGRRDATSANKFESRHHGSFAREWARLVYAWLLVVPFGLCIWLLAVLPISLRSRRVISRFLARGLCRALGISLVLEGSLPSVGEPFIVTANHSSFIDGLVLYVAVPEPLVFVTSVEIERQPILGRITKRFGCLFVQRGRAERSAASVEQLVRALKEGSRLAIFPEGSISTGSGIRVFHLGAFEAATSADCRVVPVGIRGTRDVLRAGSLCPRPGTVRVVIGQPIAPAGSDFSARVALRDEVRSAIAELCGEPAVGAA